MKTIILQISQIMPISTKIWKFFFKGILYAIILFKPKKALPELLGCISDIERVINYVAINYGGGIHPKHRLTRYHDFFVENLAPNNKILDIGCGYGAVAYSIAQKVGCSIVAVDISESSINQAIKLHSHPKIFYRVADATNMNTDFDCDVIIMSNVLEHIENRVQLITKLQQSFNPNKWLIRVPVYEREWTVPARVECGISPYLDETHFTEYTADSFNEEMKQAGLRVQSMVIRWSEIWARCSV